MADVQHRQVTLRIEGDQSSESSGDSKGESSCELNTGVVFDNQGLDQGEEVREERKENGAKIIQVQGSPDGAIGFLYRQDERCNKEEAVELRQVDGGKSIGEEQVEGGETQGEDQVDAAEAKDEESDNNSDIIDLLDPKEEEGTDPRKREDLLLEAIGKTKYHKVEAKLTAKAVMNLGGNPLVSAIRFTEKLHDRADKNEPDKEDFTDLANRVEEFTLRFLDPLKYDRRLRKRFSSNPHTDIILETAIKLKQKKFFDHPIIIDLMAEKWYGGRRYLKSSKLWWLFLNIWCLFDVVLFPLTFFAFFIAVCIQACREVIGSESSSDDSDSLENIFEHYADYFTAPYFIFCRDMLSYLALLGLHLAVCIEPSQLPFSPLEWAILVFLIGRLFMEVKQLIDLARTESEKERKRSEGEKMTRQALTKYLRYSQRLPSTKDKSTAVKALINYFRDTWNVFDIIILIIFFFVILPLRIYTWVEAESVTNNRPLAVTGYLYGLNAMFLTIRAFGQLLETIRGIGVIQIALFHIIRDAFVVVIHFIVITLAFSSTLTKIFVTEAAIFREETHNQTSICDTEMGISCWWEITKHLSWSLLELSDGLDVFKSVDSVSETLARMLFAAYLIMALILLINMLIALLSNTYQRVQDNAEKEWAFQKAIAIQTYRGYHPIPVPFNIISLFFMSFYCFRKPDYIDWKNIEADWLNVVVKELLDKYRLKYGDAFPPLYKLDQVLQDTENTESMVSQVLYRTFKSQQGRDEALPPAGQMAWDTHRAIVVEGNLLTCLGYKYYSSYATPNDRCGARYRTAFSPEFPHFEVMILETGETKWLGLGVVFEDYGTTLMPGWRDGTVGYHTDDRNIFDADYAKDYEYKETTGSGAARRGDVIRCTVLFGSEEERRGKVQVPLVFSVNGSEIILKGDQESRRETKTYIDADKPLYPYISFKYQNSVLAKMCAREDGGNQSVRLQKMESDLEELKAKLDAVLAKLER